jgi:hypothetical protein
MLAAGISVQKDGNMPKRMFLLWNLNYIKD